MVVGVSACFLLLWVIPGSLATSVCWCSSGCSSARCSRHDRGAAQLTLASLVPTAIGLLVG